jgi:hypothetical protein
MRQAFVLIITALIISSCVQAEKLPEFVTEKVSPDELKLENGFEVPIRQYSESNSSADYSGLDTLLKLQGKYYEKDNDFNLSEYNLLWRQSRNTYNSIILPPEEATRWFESTGFLFQLTGDAGVAGELERLIYTSTISGNDELQALVAPYIFSRNIDHVHVNLFFPAEISYNHSLGGGVKITSETDYPQSGNITLKFSVENKRYVVLWIRIPEWALNPSVTVKKVRYLSHPGSYSRIAKQWKEGDEVEVEFSVLNMPEYLK